MMQRLIISILFIVVLNCSQAQDFSGLPKSCQSVVQNGLGWGYCFPDAFCNAFNNGLPQGNCTSGFCCFITAVQPFKCGNKGHKATKINPRIIGGKLTGANEFCWQAAIADSEGILIGGGSLITPQWILTAAHIVNGISPERIVVQLGTPDLTNPDNCTQTFNVTEVIIHENFNSSGTLINNIALLKLRSLADITTDCVCMACLPDFSEQFEGRLCEVSGYGSTLGPGKETSSLLHSAALLVKNNNDCKQRINKFLPDFEIHPSFLCAGGDQDRQDTCSGDGGSPLVCPDASGRYVSAGIVSWGLGCGEKDLPSIYTNIVNFLPWIFTNIKMQLPTLNLVNNPSVIPIFPSMPIPTPNLVNNNPSVIPIFPSMPFQPQDPSKNTIVFGERSTQLPTKRVYLEQTQPHQNTLLPRHKTPQRPITFYTRKLENGFKSRLDNNDIYDY